MTSDFTQLLEIPGSNSDPVLYHQPEKMVKSKEDLAERQENLEKLKRQHGID